MKKHWLLLILIVAIFLLLCWSLWWSNYGLKTVRYTVGGMSLPEGFNGYHIVQLSDLHSVSLGEENGRLLKAIRAEEPDIIVMTGDMVSRYDEDFSVTLALCSALAEEYPVYYIRGNHEEGLATADWESYRAALAASRVQVLDNETVQLGGKRRQNQPDGTVVQAGLLPQVCQPLSPSDGGNDVYHTGRGTGGV